MFNIAEIVLSFASDSLFVQYFSKSYAVSRGRHYFFRYGASPTPGKKIHTCRYEFTATEIVF